MINNFKLKEATFRLDINKEFFARRFVDTKHGCPHPNVDAPFLEDVIPTVRRDGTLSSLA